MAKKDTEKIVSDFQSDSAQSLCVYLQKAEIERAEGYVGKNAREVISEMEKIIKNAEKR